MTVESDKLRDDLRASLKFSKIAIPDYATDAIVQVRLGRVLADCAARVRIRPLGEWC